MTANPIQYDSQRSSAFRRVLLLLVALVMVGPVYSGAGSAWAQSSGIGGGELSALKQHDTVQPIDITADRFEVRDEENIAVFLGKVEATQGDLQIFADTLTVYYDNAESNTDPTITRLDVSGSVRVVSPSETVNADWVVYDVVGRLLTLGDDVHLVRGDSEMRGQRLEMNLDSGVVKFDSATEDGVKPGRVHGRFSVPDDADKDSAKEPPKDQN